MLPEEGFASPAPAPGARQSLRDLQGHLQHLQSLYDDVQAQVVAQTPAGSTRRRATDPGSPAAPPSSDARLRRSTIASPLRQPLLDGIVGEGRASGCSSPVLRQGGLSPTRALTVERLHALRRSRSSSVTAIDSDATAAAPDSMPLEAGASPAACGHHRKHYEQAAAEPLGSYQQFAAQVFEERFCPLRVGMQHSQPPQQQEQQLSQPAQQPQQAQQQTFPQARQAVQQPHPGELDQQQQQPQQPHGQPAQQQPRQQGSEAVTQSRQSPQQEGGGSVQQHQRGSLLGAPLAGFAAGDPSTPLDRQRAGGGQAPNGSTGASSSGGSVLSYASEAFASEEGDAVLLASPAKGGDLSPAASPVACSMPGPAPAAVAPARCPSASSEGRYAASPLPLLDEALQLSGPAQPQGMARAAAVAMVPTASSDAVALRASQQEPPAQSAPASAALAASTAAAAAAAGVCGSAAPVGLRPHRLEFDHPSSSEPAAVCVQAASHDGSQAQQQRAALQDVVPAAHSSCVAVGKLPAPTDSQGSEGAPPASAEQSQQQAAGSSRVQALLRLKLRRLQQQPASSSSASAECHLQLSSGAPTEQAVKSSSAVAAASRSPVHPARSPADKPAHEPRWTATSSRTVQEDGRPGSSSQAGWSPRRAHPQAALVSPRGQQERGIQEQQEGQEAHAPKPFLRRRTERIPMQRLPNWRSVRSRTSSRWEGDEGSEDSSSRPSTPGVDIGSTPTGSRATTPHVPGPSPHAQQQRQQRPTATGSRLAGSDSGTRTGRRLGAGASAAAPLGGWEEESEEAAYSLERPVVARIGSRGRNADAAAGRAAGQPGAQQQRQRTPRWGAPPRERSPGLANRHPGYSSARNTPFAPRPSSGSHGGGHKGRWQQLPQPTAQRPRGTPLYDASSLLPLDPDNLQLDHLLHGGGNPAAAPEELQYGSMHHGGGGDGSSGVYFGGGGDGSSMLYGGGGGGSVFYAGAGDDGSMFHGGGGGGNRWPLTGGGDGGSLFHGGGGGGNRRPPTGRSSGRRPPTGGSSGRPACGNAGMAAAGAGGDIGPLDDLLSQVDRMLHQVERAIS